jgi:hypothetical protein
MKMRLLPCCAVTSGRYWPTFQKNEELLPPQSGRWRHPDNGGNKLWNYPDDRDSKPLWIATSVDEACSNDRAAVVPLATAPGPIQIHKFINSVHPSSLCLIALSCRRGWPPSYQYRLVQAATEKPPCQASHPPGRAPQWERVTCRQTDDHQSERKELIACRKISFLHCLKISLFVVQDLKTRNHSYDFVPLCQCAWLSVS